MRILFWHGYLLGGTGSNVYTRALAREWSRGGHDAVFVGSDHIREALEEIVGPIERVYEVPPGVNVDGFTPQPREEALALLLDECRRDPPNPGNADFRLPDEGNAERLERFFAADEP